MLYLIQQSYHLANPNSDNYYFHFMDIGDFKERVSANGFTVIENVFTNEEVELLLSTISDVNTTKPTFRKTSELFAIRQFLKEIPATLPIIFNDKLKVIISQIFGEDYFIVKSIYFDKPEQSNWFVAYHQDLTISVNTKQDIPGFGPWTVKQDQYAVQPPVNILQNNFTIRIHLDDTTEENGALKVIPASHLKEIYRPDTIDWKIESDVFCNVPKGGIMIMKPLLLHASERTTNNNKRRVIHIEFSNANLPEPLQWSEYMKIN